MRGHPPHDSGQSLFLEIEDHICIQAGLLIAQTTVEGIDATVIALPVTTELRAEQHVLGIPVLSSNGDGIEVA